jgi:NADH dehydrogenase
MAVKGGKKHVIAVGGGFASVKLALELGHDDNFDVTLLSPHQELEYHGALYRTATGHSPLEVSVPFREIFKQVPNVNIVNDLLVDVRAQTSEIKGQSGRTYSYDALVLGIGFEVEYFGIKGMREHAESMYTLYDAIKLRNKLRDTFIKKPGQVCNIVLIGAGPTGIELACDIDNLVKLVAKTYNIEPAKPHITIVDRADRVLPQLSPEVSKIAADRLKELGIHHKLKTAVDHCTKNHLCLANKEVMPADVIVWTAGSRANSFFERYPELFTLDPSKRVYVSEFLQANSPDVYVMGDSASLPYSGMAQTAIDDAIQLAKNFKRFTRGEEIVPYKPHMPVYVVPMGGEWAIAQQGKEIVSGREGWNIRRQADFFVLHNFLSKEVAEEHWNAEHQAAHI